MSRLNRPLLKELVFKFLLKAQLNIYLHIYICQYKLKGVQFGGFGGQFACSWAGADPEILVPDLGGLSLTDVLVVFYLLFTKCSN